MFFCLLSIFESLGWFFQVRADVTEGPEKLAQAIGDAEAVVCATGFRYSWDIFAPWKVNMLVLLLCKYQEFFLDN